MGQISLRALSESVRLGEGQLQDLVLRLAAQDDVGRLLPGAPTLLVTGGRWDKSIQAYADVDHDSEMVVGLHPGQLEAARWLAEWFDAKAKGQEVRDAQGRALFSLLLHGGRRAGKTDVACKAAVAYALMRPKANVWLISENIPKTEELEGEVLRWLPADWFTYRGAPYYQMRFVNGSTVWLRSAHTPSGLKRGRCDFAVLNEAQNMAEEAFATVRAATADNGGLTVLAANPPEKPIGFWVEDFFEQARAGKRAAKEICLDASKNPHVNRESLFAMKGEVDERTYRREILGEFLPRENVVFHAWSNSTVDGNVRPSPDVGADVTSDFLRRYLRRDLDRVIGMDFQRVPYPCAVELRAFKDPLDPHGDPLIWYVETTICDDGDEESLSQALVSKGYDPARTAVIADASGAFQGIDRAKKIPSFTILQRLGWRHVFKPDENMDRNPLNMERAKATNARMRSATGIRRLFSSPDNLQLNVALKMWDTKFGKPNRFSPHSHLCDAATYPIWRFYPRTLRQRIAPPKPDEMHVVTLGGSGPRTV